MRYTPKQHATVDAELELMWMRLIEMAVEIDNLSPQAQQKRWSYVYACQAAEKIAEMRAALEREQEYQREGEEFRREMGKG
ncbi:MAG TPA: hypothetical protein PKE45_04580 [Caldilineaceae bacterium]|nr:hypothetical protein [Caldilineaceae bacterium]